MTRYVIVALAVVWGLVLVSYLLAVRRRFGARR